MPALEVDPDALPRDEREALLSLLAGPKILAEPEGGAGIGWMLLAGLGAAGFGLLLFWGGLGVVASPWAAHGLWVAGLYGLAAAMLTLGLAKAAIAIRMRRLPWKAGRYLLPSGFIDARRRPLRMRPIEDLTKVEIQESEGDSSLRLYTIHVHFGDETEKFHLFGFASSVPRDALDGLLARRDAELGAERSEGGYRLPGGARRPPKREGESARGRFRLLEHPWKAAGIAGILAIAPIDLALLPALSLRAAEADGSVRALRAAQAAYPYGWVKDRSRPAIHRRFEAARSAAANGIAPERRALVERLLTYLEGHDRSLVRVRLLVPGDEQLAAATRAAEALVEGAAEGSVAKVVLHYQVVSLAGIRVGQSELAGGLSARLAPLVPADVMELAGEPSGLGEPPGDPEDPVIEIASSIAPAAIFQGTGSRLFAALSFDYEAWLLIPGEPKALLAEEVTVPPPPNLSISRFTFGKEEPRPLGSSGDPFLDRLDESMVYTKQAEIAAGTGAAKLADRLLR